MRGASPVRIDGLGRERAAVVMHYTFQSSLDGVISVLYR